MSAVCNHDCFNCPFPDCISDELTAEDYRMQREAEKIANPKSRKEQEIAAKKRAYYEANKDEIAAKKRAGVHELVQDHQAARPLLGLSQHLL